MSSEKPKDFSTNKEHSIRKQVCTTLKTHRFFNQVIMFLSKSDEETTFNRKLAKDLVHKWSRPIFNKSTRFEDMRKYEDERTPIRRSSMKKPMNKASRMHSKECELTLYKDKPRSDRRS